MAGTGPAVDLHAAGPATASIRIVGVAHGRWVLADGRPADHPWRAAEMVTNFAPGCVPILTRHGGMQVGTIDTLTAERSDLRFTGTVMDDEWLRERLRRGVPVSIEPVEGLPPRLDGRPYVPDYSLRDDRPYFTGQLGLGYNLVGVALLLRGEQPAAPWSAAWSVD